MLNSNNNTGRSIKRIFAAIKIYPDNTFLNLYNKLKYELKYDKIKWVNTYNVHITLKFFGDTEEEHIEPISNIFKEIALNTSRFNLLLHNVGIFGSSYKPKVIWFGIEKSKDLLKLSGNIHNKLESIGYERDRQNFIPHLTIGRIKYIGDKKMFQKTIDKFKTIKIQKIDVNNFFLIESILKREGPEYKIIETFNLI